MPTLAPDKYRIALVTLDTALLVDQGKEKVELNLPALLFAGDMTPEDFHHAYHDQELARQKVVTEALQSNPRGQVYLLFKSLIDSLVDTHRYDAEALMSEAFYGIKS